MNVFGNYNDQILHAFSAVVYAVENYGITDSDVLDAIENHTVGKPNMSPYAEIIFISDYIEPNRTYESCIKVRNLVETSLPLAIYTAIDDSIRHFEAKGDQIPTIAYKARTFYQEQSEVLHGKN